MHIAMNVLELSWPVDRSPSWPSFQSTGGGCSCLVEAMDGVSVTVDVGFAGGFSDGFDDGLGDGCGDGWNDSAVIVGFEIWAGRAVTVANAVTGTPSAAAELFRLEVKLPLPIELDNCEDRALYALEVFVYPSVNGLKVTL